MSAPLMAAYAAILNDSRGQNLGNFNQAVYPFATQGAFHTPASMGSRVPPSWRSSPRETSTRAWPRWI